MSDLIDRQEAIDACTRQRREWNVSCNVTVARCIEAISELPSAEPKQTWTPCSERMPEEPFGCLVTVWDTDTIAMEEFENILPYFVGWDGEQWNDGEGKQCPFEVIAWMPLPESYQEDNR